MCWEEVTEVTEVTQSAEPEKWLSESRFYLFSCSSCVHASGHVFLLVLVTKLLAWKTSHINLDWEEGCNHLERTRQTLLPISASCFQWSSNKTFYVIHFLMGIKRLYGEIVAQSGSGRHFIPTAFCCTAGAQVILQEECRRNKGSNLWRESWDLVKSSVEFGPGGLFTQRLPGWPAVSILHVFGFW